MIWVREALFLVAFLVTVYLIRRYGIAVGLLGVALYAFGWGRGANEDAAE